jgi:hypothetical protein
MDLADRGDTAVRRVRQVLVGVLLIVVACGDDSSPLTTSGEPQEFASTTSATGGSVTTTGASSSSTGALGGLEPTDGVSTRQKCDSAMLVREPSAVPIEEVPLAFDTGPVPTDIVSVDAMYAGTGGFVLVGGRISHSVNGLDWTVFGFGEAPSPGELGISTPLPDPYGMWESVDLGELSSSPGLGDLVELFRVFGDEYEYYDLCLPEPDGGVTAYRLPFGGESGYGNVRLVGVTGDTVVLTVEWVDPSRALPILGGRYTFDPESNALIDADSGRRLAIGFIESSVELTDTATGEVVAVLSAEEFPALFERGALLRSATAAPPVVYLAWSTDPARGWSIAALAGQVPEAGTAVRAAALSPAGVFVALVRHLPALGRLVDPTDTAALEAIIDDDALANLVGERLGLPPTDAIVRAQVPLP